MTNYTGGQQVKAGFYWNRGKLAVELIAPEGGTLPGEATTTYQRVPWPILLIIAPAMGGAFAVFLPFIGFAMLVQFAWAALTGRRGLRRGEARI